VEQEPVAWLMGIFHEQMEGLIKMEGRRETIKLLV